MNEWLKWRRRLWTNLINLTLVYCFIGFIKNEREGN